MNTDTKTHGIFIAELETLHFSFRAAGRTEYEARKALAIGWKAHAKEYGKGRAHVMIAPISEWEDCIRVYEINVGDVYRDGTKIV